MATTSHSLHLTWWDGSFKEVWLDNVDNSFLSCNDPWWRVRGYGPDRKPNGQDEHDEWITFRQPDGHWKAKVRYSYQGSAEGCKGRFEIIRTTGPDHHDTEEITMIDWDGHTHKVKLTDVHNVHRAVQPSFIID
jgi:hypothetical protein